MALTRTIRPGGTAHCPECKEPISQQANKCPHWHSDLTENEDWQEAREKRESEGGGAPLLLISGAVIAGISYAAFWTLTA